MLFGYAHVITKEQKLTSQKDALRSHGCKKSIPMLRNAREGDTIVVWKLDRLGRSLLRTKNQNLTE